VQLAFVGNLPIPAAPAISAGGEVSAGWVVDQSAGLYQEGCDPQGNYAFKPLFQMKRMRPKFLDRIFRDSPEPERVGDDLFVFSSRNETCGQLTNTTTRRRWLDAEAPWNPLDDDGEEEEFYDDVSWYLRRRVPF
jgi:hypothetical protein